MTLLFIFAAIAWLLIGATGFIFAETSYDNISVYEIPLLFIGALLGPVAWIAACACFGEEKKKSGEAKILFRKRS